MMKQLEADEIEAMLSMTGVTEADYFGGRSIGASTIGKECEAAVAFHLRSFPKVLPSEKATRIFDHGHHIEGIVISYLAQAGFDVVTGPPIGPSKGKQFAYYGYEKHVVAKVDGIILWDASMDILEIKSANLKRFKAMRNKGVRIAEPKYYQQVVASLGLSGHHSCLFVAYCKDNSEFHVERIEFDDEAKDLWRALQTKIDRVLTSQAERISDDPNLWLCKMCDSREACWKGAIPPKGLLQCHHCVHASPDINHTWWCNRFGMHPTKVCPEFEPYAPKPKP